ncbi:MAG: hypothetical protein ACP5JE_05985 [Thermoplasmata archaeon]
MGFTDLQTAIDYLRNHIRDTPELNDLLQASEFTDADLAKALNESLDIYNNTPPPLQPVTLQTIPSISVLIDGAAIRLLKSGGFLHIRNQLPFTDEGVTVDLHAKAQQYTQWIANYIQDYQQLLKSVKIAQNLAQAYGAVYASFPTEFF